MHFHLQDRTVELRCCQDNNHIPWLQIRPKLNKVSQENKNGVLTTAGIVIRAFYFSLAGTAAAAIVGIANRTLTIQTTNIPVDLTISPVEPHKANKKQLSPHYSSLRSRSLAEQNENGMKATNQLQ